MTYSTQPLNYARNYTVRVKDAALGEYSWAAIVAGQERLVTYGFAYKSPVVAESEIVNGYENDCMAGFNQVQFRGNYSWMYFDEDNRIEEDPFSLIWYETWKYSTHAGNL